MVSIRRLHNEKAGFINDVSNIIANEAWKLPSLFPDLSADKTLFVFSDYSRGQGIYKTYSFLIIGRSGADLFNATRKIVRTKFQLKNRRMSYKGLNDNKKLNALPAFLSCAAAMNGVLVTFAVDTKIKYMFAEQFLQIDRDFSAIKKSTFEDMLRVAHFGAQAIMTVFSNGQSIVWFTDSDAIVANEEHEQVFGKFAEGLIRNLFMPQETINRIAFGLSEIDDDSRQIEDFISIPDLVAGALCETLDRLYVSGVRVTPSIALKKPHVTTKTNIICGWVGHGKHPLKKFGVVFDKTGTSQWDFRPKFFTIMNQDSPFTEMLYAPYVPTWNLSDPISFDIEDRI